MVLSVTVGTLSVVPEQSYQKLTNLSPEMVQVQGVEFVPVHYDVPAVGLVGSLQQLQQRGLAAA